MRDLRRHNHRCHYSKLCIQIISLALVIHGCYVCGAAPPNSVPHFRSRDELPQRPPSKYKYSYNVRGIEGDQHGHQASYDGGFATGKYYVKLNQGTSQNVEYYTDQLGYHPKVVYRSQLDSGKSGARVILGGNADSFSTSIRNDSETASGEYISTPAPSTVADYTTTKTIELSTAQPTFDTTVTGHINPNFGSRLSGDSPFENNGTGSINNYFRYTAAPSDITSANQTNEFAAAPTDPVNTLYPFAPAANAPADVYLQPEYNEIANGFLGKIMSVVPGIKFLRPIIVTDAGVPGTTANGSVSGDVKPDQAADSAQLHELQAASPYAQLILAGVSVLSPKNGSLSTLVPEKEEGTAVEQSSNDQDSEGPKTIVDVEPQTIEKQAVITTNMDISKSVPLTMNFLPEVDNNNLNEPRTNGPIYPSNEQQRAVFGYPPFNALQVPNTIPSFIYPPGVILAKPPQPLEALANYPTNENPQRTINSLPPQLNFLTQATPQQSQYLNAIGTAPQLFNGPPRYFQLPFPTNLPSAAPTFLPPQSSSPLTPDFRYVSIPILQHQPNVIPLNYVDNAQNQVDIGTVPTNLPQAFKADNQSTPVADTISEADSSPTQETISKRENYSSDRANSIASDLPSPKPIKPSFFDPGFHSQQPFAYQVPAAQLIPYVKQITNSPYLLQIHPYTHLLKQQQQQQQQQQLQLRSSPIRAHSVSYNVRQFPKEQYRKPLTKTAPFKPSHPVWDSIYPPQHMYQVPYYVVDKIPNERKARDSSYRRNQRRVRRLFVEYGGFKPPMIPSTLLEVEETSDNTEVPTNVAD